MIDKGSEFRGMASHGLGVTVVKVHLFRRMYEELWFLCKNLIIQTRYFHPCMCHVLFVEDTVMKIQISNLGFIEGRVILLWVPLLVELTLAI